MITIKTQTSEIVYSNGAKATGVLQITPSEPFTFLDIDDLKRKRVSLETMQVSFSSGKVAEAGFKLAPTVNAQNNKSNLYYKVKYITASSTWTENWIIDGNGPTTLEIADVTKIEPEPDIVPSIEPDDVTVTPTANMIPRADGSGAIDLGWFPAMPLNMLINGYIGTRTSFVIPNGVFAFIVDTSDGQVYFWDGADFHAVGTCHMNTALNSANPITLAAYIGNPLPTPAAGTLAIGADVGQGQVFFFDGATWGTISSCQQSPQAFVGTSERWTLVGVIAKSLPTIGDKIIAVGYDTKENQRKVWVNVGWNVIA